MMATARGFLSFIFKAFEKANDAIVTAMEFIDYRDIIDLFTSSLVIIFST
jgi:hypothetical protein